MKTHLDTFKESFQDWVKTGVDLQAGAVEVPLTMAEELGFDPEKVDSVRKRNKNLMDSFMGIFRPLLTTKD